MGKIEGVDIEMEVGELGNVDKPDRLLEGERMIWEEEALEVLISMNHVLYSFLNQEYRECMIPWESIQGLRYPASTDVEFLWLKSLMLADSLDVYD